MDELNSRTIGFLQWDGWTGTLEYCLDDNTYFGQLVSSPNKEIKDLVSYESDGRSTSQIFEEFKDTILDYKDILENYGMDF